MIYQISLDQLPTIDKMYLVTRHTIWQTVEHSHILIYITSGSCYIKSEGNTTLLKEGSYIIIPKNIHYIRYPINNTSCTMYYLHFDAPLESITYSNSQQKISDLEKHYNEYFYDYDALTPNQNTIYLLKTAQLAEKSDIFKQLLENIIKNFRACTIISNLLTATEACRFFVMLSGESITHILNENELPKIKTDLPMKLQMAILYIKQHHTEQLSLESLCEHCKVSKQYLIRCFKTHLQTTPTSYIIQYKISKACNLLQNSNANIQEISNELGFENQCYFSRIFTKKMGESPSQFRTRVLNSKEKTN